MSLTTLSYSQNIQDNYPKLLNDGNVVITQIQLKNANKLFIKSTFLEDKVELQRIQLSNLEEILFNTRKIIELKNQEISEITKNRNKISNNFNNLQKKHIKTKKKNRTIVIISAISGFLLGTIVWN